MGYIPKPKPVEIKLDGEYEGFEATARGLTLGEYLDVVDGDDVGPYEMTRRFVASLLSWNVETEDGTPVLPTPEAAYALDKGLMIKAAEVWIAGLSGVSKDDPLPESSPGGELSPVESTLPMAPLSESPESSPVPS